MAMAARNQTLARRAPARRRPASARPRLGVIEGGRTGAPKAGAGSRAHRTARPRSAAATTRAAQASQPARISAGLCAIAISALFILLLVLLNVYVAQSSFRLNELHKQVSLQQNKYRQMRYQVSQAQSPARLAEVAESVGLVTPVLQESLEGRPLAERAERRTEMEVTHQPNLKALLRGRL